MLRLTWHSLADNFGSTECLPKISDTEFFGNCRIFLQCCLEVCGQFCGSSEVFRKLPTIYRRCSENFRMIVRRTFCSFRSFLPKITEDFRRLARKKRRSFDIDHLNTVVDFVEYFDIASLRHMRGLYRMRRSEAEKVNCRNAH